MTLVTGGYSLEAAARFINVLSSNPAREVHSIYHCVIKFVSDMRQVGGFLHQ